MMASDGASPLQGPDVTMKPGAALSSFTALPFPPPAPGPPDQPLWEPSAQPSLTSAFSPGNSVVLSAFPSPLLVTGDSCPGPSGAGAGTGKVIVKVKAEGGPVEPSQTQNFILTQTALSWIASGTPCGGSEGTPAQYITASNMKTILPTEAVGVSQEGPPGLPPQAPPPAAQLAPIVPPEKSWPGPQGAIGEGGPVATQKPSLGDLAYTSKGVYENFRRWQRYKALARRHVSQSPDVEALSCFLIPVLRSLARLKPTMTLEEGLPRAVQEWEHTSNFDRMNFYEMAEKFMEFEAEEELQIQNTQLMNGSQGLSPVAPLKSEPPGPLAPEVCQQPVYIPKKAASKTRAPRRRQRKPQRPPVPEAPKEIPPEAVKEYIDIMEGLEGSHLAIGELDGKQELQQEDEAIFPDPSLLSYIDELCSQEIFVSKVEAVIHPQFMADLLSPEQERDPLALIEELEQEEGLTFAQLVQKRLSALEQEDVEAPPNCSAAQLISSHSVSDKNEGGGGRPRPSPGPLGAGGTVCIGKAVSSGKQAREMHGGQPRVGKRRDGNTLPSCSSWDLQVELGASQGTQAPLGTERRGSRKVINQMSPCQNGHLRSAGSPGHCLVANRTSEPLPLCWQEGPQPKKALILNVELSKPTSPQGQGLEKQVLGLQTTQQMGGLEMLPQGKEASAVPQEGSSMCRDDRGPPLIQNCDQKHSPGAAGDRDRASLSPGLWLSSEMDAVGLELPLQIEEVIESFKDGECITEHQARGTRNSISLGPGKTTVLGDVGGSVVPCGDTDARAALEKRNYCSLPVPLRASSPALESKKNRKQSPETTQDPTDLWDEGCSILESRVGTSTLGSSKETLLPACQSNLILGTQDASSFSKARKEAGSRGNPFSSLLETTEHINILDVRDNCGLQLAVSEDTCPTNFTCYDPQGGAREDKGLSKPNDLVPLPGNQEAFTLRIPKSTSPHQGLRSSSPRWGTRDALVLGETSPMSKTHNLDVAKGREKEEEGDEEDEGLSNFAYLLASKLSLSPRGPTLSPCQASGGRAVQRGSHSSAEEKGLSQAPYPVKSGKRAAVGGPVPAEKRSQSAAQLGVSGEKPLALGAVRPSQPRKRRRDSFVAGRRKKRRRSQ